MRLILLLSAFLLGTPAVAQEPEWRTAPEYDVLLRPFAYEPQVIRLQAGRPVKLRLVNGGRATHSFSAGEFFRASRLRSRDAERLRDGTIEVPPGERLTVALVPTPGRYRMRSSNRIHRLLGMHGEIIVE